MKDYSKIYLFLLIGGAAMPLQAAEPQTGSGETDGYTLVWQELFNGTQLNPLRWEIEVNGDGGGNNELQYYREENVSVGPDGEGNNCMILTARRENFNGKSFTSGRVVSKNRVTFKHGKVEASIKLPTTANGLWPAFWMMGNDYDAVGWPKCGETDILEMGNENGIKFGTSDKYFNGAMHWGQGWPAASYAKSTTIGYSLQDGAYHLFTAIWDEEAMRMYVDLDKNPDQKPYFEMTIPCDNPGDEWSPGNYFHKDNFILFNLAVGGDFTGIHNPSDITALNDDNGQEARMMINYVRIYQKGTDDESLFTVTAGDSDDSGVDDVMAGSVGMTPTALGLMCGADGRLTVTSLTGIIVFDGEVNAGETRLSDLAGGVYVARLKTAGGNVATIKFTR